MALSEMELERRTQLDDIGKPYCEECGIDSRGDLEGWIVVALYKSLTWDDGVPVGEVEYEGDALCSWECLAKLASRIAEEV